MVLPYDGKYQTNSGANTSYIAKYQDLPNGFLPSQFSSALSDPGIYPVDETYGCHFINCNAELVDDIKEQKAEHTYDGVHLYANAY